MDECGWMLSLADLAVKGNPAAVCLLEEERDDRWLQVELCGHATLAASYTLFKSGLIFSDIIEFSTLSGILTAKKVLDVKTANDEAQESSYFIELHFPAAPSNEFNSDEVSVYLHALNGAFLLMKEGGQLSQDDLLDPFCGSAHCVLASYWCKKLGKSDVVGYLASHGGGRVRIHLDEQNQRVLRRGKAVTV
ncbi:hypothetical protein ACFX1Q_008744 [Malus domestica]